MIVDKWVWRELCLFAKTPWWDRQWVHMPLHSHLDGWRRYRLFRWI
jgi:hypothetical protein